jgi:hypothetical protein
MQRNGQRLPRALMRVYEDVGFHAEQNGKPDQGSGFPQSF